MSGRPGTPAQDPTWYRIRYSLAAQRLHTASAGDYRVLSDDWKPSDALGEETRNLIDGLRKRLEPAMEEEAVKDGFITAGADARGLLADIVGVLDASGWRWVGRRPAWIVRVWHRLWSRLLHRLSRRRWSRRPAVIDFRLANFLDTVVEPATVALLLSARVGQGWRPKVTALASTSDRESSQREMAGPLDRRDREVSDSWLECYLEQLLASEPARPRLWKRLLARLGVARFRQRAPLGYRVEYNLACLFSRLVPFYEETMEVGRPNLVDLAATHLQRSIGAAAGRRRKRVASWAWQDPGLAGLRGRNRRLFEIIVGPLSGVAE